MFLAIVGLLGHNTPVLRQSSTSPDAAPERLTDLSRQLQAEMPLWRDIVQPEKAEAETALSASGPSPSAAAGARSRCAKRGRESWAVRDSRKGDALLALTKEKKGAASLLERLEADERSIAHLAVVTTIPNHARVDGRPA